MQDAGSRMQEAGCRKQEAGSRKQEAGSRKQEAGSRKASRSRSNVSRELRQRGNDNTPSDSRIRVIVGVEHELLRFALCAVFERARQFRLVAAVASADKLPDLHGQTSVTLAVLDLPVLRTRLESGRAQPLPAANDSAKLALVCRSGEHRLLHLLPPVRLAALFCFDCSVARLTTDLLKASRSENPWVCEELQGRLATDTLSAMAESKSGDAATKLTVRETAVLTHIADGRSDKWIADELGIGLRTANDYRTRIKRKVGLSKSVELARLAVALGLVDSQVDRPLRAHGDAVCRARAPYFATPSRQSRRRRKAT
jgi:DNA-binding NarL/FixJ family response regulator